MYAKEGGRRAPAMATHAKTTGHFRGPSYVHAIHHSDQKTTTVCTVTHVAMTSSGFAYLAT
jgi:hypothetical protein